MMLAQVPTASEPRPEDEPRPEKVETECCDNCGARITDDVATFCPGAEHSSPRSDPWAWADRGRYRIVEASGSLDCRRSTMESLRRACSEVLDGRFLQRPYRLLALACTVPLLLLLAGCDTSLYSPPDPNATSSESINSTTTSVPAVTTSAPSSTTTTPSTTTTSSSTTTSTSTTTTTEAMVAPGTVLYEITDWSTGMGGWAATGQ